MGKASRHKRKKERKKETNDRRKVTNQQRCYITFQHEVGNPPARYLSWRCDNNWLAAGTLKERMTPIGGKERVWRRKEGEIRLLGFLFPFPFWIGGSVHVIYISRRPSSGKSCKVIECQSVTDRSNFIHGPFHC